MKLKLLLMLSFITLTAACLKVAPREKPEPPVPEKIEKTSAPAFQEKTSAEAETSASSNADPSEMNATPVLAFPETPIPWDQFVKDQRLASLISLALENNRDLRVAAAKIEQARAYYLISKSDRLPQLDRAAAANKTRTPAAANSSGSGYSGEYYQAGAQVSSFELDIWGRLRYQSEAAQANFLAATWAARSVRLALIGQVGQAYLEWFFLGQRLELGRANLKSVEDSRALVKKLYEAGISSVLDLRQAEAAVAQTKAQLADLERLRSISSNQLELLAGARPEQLPEMKGYGEQLFLQEPPDEIGSNLLLARPDIQQAEQVMIAAGANIGSARAAFYPRISLSGAIGLASLSLGNLFNQSNQWSYGLGLGLPLFDGSKRRANLLHMKAKESENVAQYESAIQKAFNEVANLLASRSQLDQQIEALQSLRIAQLERQHIAQRRYEAGVDNYLQVLSAQSDLFHAEQSLVSARQTRLQASMSLYVALGGSLAELP